MRTRTITVIAASVGVAVATATGVTYASSALESTPKSTPPKSAPVVVEKPAPAAGAPAAAPLGGTGAHEEHDARRKDDEHHHHGRIHINERSYPAAPGSCITVVNVISNTFGAVSFNIRNESDKTLEFFTGATCDNGPAVATVGPRSSSNAIPGVPAGAIIVGSFRTIDHDNNNHHDKH